MKMTVAVAAALATYGLLGCAQHSTAPAVERPATPPAASSDTNMFGESKDDSAGNAESARAANFGTGAPPAAGANPPAPQQNPPPPK